MDIKQRTVGEKEVIDEDEKEENTTEVNACARLRLTRPDRAVPHVRDVPDPQEQEQERFPADSDCVFYLPEVSPSPRLRRGPPCRRPTSTGTPRWEAALFVV